MSASAHAFEPLLAPGANALVMTRSDQAAVLGPLLEQLGLRALVARSGIDARRMLSQQPIALLLLESALMPRGLARLQRWVKARQSAYLDTPPVVLVLAPTNDAASLAKCCGLALCLPPPRSLQELRDALTAVHLAPILNLSAMMQLYGSPVIVERLLQSLQVALAEDQARLAQALAQGDDWTASHHLHRIAGGLTTVSVGSLAEQARSLSHRLQQSSLGRSATDLAQFQLQLQILQLQLRATLHTEAV